MRRKKNRFLLFCCSFLPGAGEMYLGFMKMGISLMGVFMLLLVISGMSGFGILSIVSMVVWAYSFFHSNNLGGMTVEELNYIKDEYLFVDSDLPDTFKKSLAGKYRKVLAVILILIGFSMLWDMFSDIMYDVLGADLFNRYFARISGMVTYNIPRFIISVVIIWIGVKLIMGKKQELDNKERSEEFNQTTMIEKKDE